MKDGKHISIILLVISTLLGGLGQFLFKYAFGYSEPQFAIVIAGGLGLYAISTAIYFYVLSRVNLSWAYGLTGISYIVAVALAASVLAEHVSLLRWSGVIVIALGVVLVSIS